MAVDNTTVGSVLTIPDGLLKNLEKVDEKLENIQKKARKTVRHISTNKKQLIIVAQTVDK